MFDNPYTTAVYGWIFFNFLMLGFSKDEKDEKKKYFDFKIWWRYHWDNVIITLLAIPIIVEYSGDLWRLIINEWLGHGAKYSPLSLLGSVPLVQFIYWIIRKLKK